MKKKQEYELPWQPMLPEEVRDVLRGAEFPWWIAGGYAIEHFVGHRIREHANVDVMCLRKHQQQMRSMLKGWDCWAADTGGLVRQWDENEALPDNINTIWCRENSNSPWRIELIFDEGDEIEWHSIRSNAVHKPVNEIGLFSVSGVPFLVPEVQLFYKSESPRDKDEEDFAASLPLLSAYQRAWLSDAIIVAYGKTNKWLAHMTLLFI